MPYLSLGENCLPVAVLKRHGFDSIITPFSYSRSNLDYAIQLEEKGYLLLLDRRFLEPGLAGETRVVRNIGIRRCDPIYNELHCEGFEFTHYDVINSERHRASFERKIARLNSIRGNCDVCFFYHYRFSENHDLQLLLEKARQFSSFYAINNRRCRFVIFTQQLIEHREDRGIVEIQYSDDIRAFVFRTLDVWGGDDDDMFWARSDDDLFRQMFRTLKML